MSFTRLLRHGAEMPGSTVRALRWYEHSQAVAGHLTPSCVAVCCSQLNHRQASMAGTTHVHDTVSVASQVPRALSSMSMCHTLTVAVSFFWKCGMDSVFFATGCPRRDVGSHRHRDGYGCNSTDTRIIEHGLPTRRTDPLLSVTAPLTIRAVSGVFDSSPLPCFASPGGVSASGCCSRCRAEAPRCQWHQTDDRGVQLLHRRGAAVSRATADASTPSLWSSRYDSCCRRGDIVQRPSYIIGLSRKGRTRSVLIILKIVNFMTHICPWLLKSLCEI